MASTPGTTPVEWDAATLIGEAKRALAEPDPLGMPLYPINNRQCRALVYAVLSIAESLATIAERGATLNEPPG